jgi:tetratricopeptide (TPR) repeat protein
MEDNFNNLVFLLNVKFPVICSKMKNLVISSFVLLCIFSGEAFSQAGWNWGENEDLAKEKYALYTDAFKNGNFEVSLDPLIWLLTNTPDLNESIYINGAKIYSELANKEADAAKKDVYIAKSLEMYDKRIEYFDGGGDVLNRKATAAYNFYKKDKGKYPVLYSFYEAAFAVDVKDIHTNNLVAYMDVIRLHKGTGGKLTDDEVFEKYEKINEIIDSRSVEDKEKMNKVRELVDRLLISTVKVDCDFVINNLGLKLRNNMQNLKLAKKVMALSLASNCSDDPIFLVAAKIVQKSEPDFGIAKVIGMKSAAEGDFDNALKYYNEAIELSNEPEKKGEIYYEIAIQYLKNGNKPQARAYAYKAVQEDASLKKSYKLIGDLYFNSFNECKEDQSKVQDRAIYLAAYEKYKLAGDQKMMQSAMEQFPSINDIFELNMEEGQAINVGCWINETVILQRRPSS